MQQINKVVNWRIVVQASEGHNMKMRKPETGSAARCGMPSRFSVTDRHAGIQGARHRKEGVSMEFKELLSRRPAFEEMVHMKHQNVGMCAQATMWRLRGCGHTHICPGQHHTDLTGSAGTSGVGVAMTNGMLSTVLRAASRAMGGAVTAGDT